MYCMHIKEKVGTPKSKFFFENFAVCLIICTRQTKKTNGKSVQLPCVFFSTRQRKMNGGWASFAVWQTAGTRQTKRLQPFQTVPECLPCAQRLTHGKEESFAVCFALPCFFSQVHGQWKIFTGRRIFNVCLFTGHTTKALFAVCYIFSVCCSSGTR